MLLRRAALSRVVRCSCGARPAGMRLLSTGGEPAADLPTPSPQLHDKPEPAEIVEKLGRFVIGQDDAKRAVALALRSRWRRAALPEELRREVFPMNIMMRGPTGSGKTEIARRLADLCDAPFVKVEATAYTEVGIVGRDTQTMVRDLAESALRLEQRRLRKERASELRERAAGWIAHSHSEQLGRAGAASADTLALARAIETGSMDDLVFDFRLPAAAAEDQAASASPSGMPDELAELMRTAKAMLSDMQQDRGSGGRAGETAGPAGGPARRGPGGGPTLHMSERVSVRDALWRVEEAMVREKSREPEVAQRALRNAEDNGIIFIDEIDKLAPTHAHYSGGGGGGSWRKGEGVQRELLSVLEGTSVPTRAGVLRTHHVLFICAGAFHAAKPTDLMPELQGRLPIRVQLEALTGEQLRRILTDTHYSLVHQAQAMLATEGIKLDFTPCGVQEIASVAERMNSAEDIGARRLRTVMAKVTEALSFNAPLLVRAAQPRHIVVDAAYVRSQVQSIIARQDLSKYIL